MKNRKIVILDGERTNPGDLSWDALRALGDLTVYPATAPEQLISHIGDSEIVILDKPVISRQVMEACPSVKLITPLLLPESQMSLHHRPWQSLRAVQENLANIPFSGVSFSFSLLPPYLIKLLGSAEMKHRCSGIAEMIPDLGLEREGAPCEFQ